MPGVQLMTVAAEKPTWGGRRHGKSVQQHIADGTYRPDRHDPDYVRKPGVLELDDPVLWMVERIGLSPRLVKLRPDLEGSFEVVSPGVHFDRFLRHFCRHTRQVPSGPPLGSPFALEPPQLAFFEEAFSVDGSGSRIYGQAASVQPRKTGKTTGAGGASLYLGSPADGEHRPEVIMAAGTLKQTGKLSGQTVAFINDKRYGSAELQALFQVLTTEIRCPSIGGVIQRVAGDGDSNHSLDPHAVVADELHTWKTPKQRENWKALTTAQGAREDPFVLTISTEGEGDENELAQLLDRVFSSPTVVRDRVNDCLTIYRDTDSGFLAYFYAIPTTATLQDVDAFVRASPASWRTHARIAKDLATPMVDEPTKLRLYGNRRAHHRDRWISQEKWDECLLDTKPGDFMPAEALIAVGADGARTRDTTAVAWAWIDELDRCRIQVRVWSTRRDVPHHVFVEGGRLNNDDARDFIRSELMGRFSTRLLFYDERYFDDQAEDLSRDGLTVTEMHQGKPEMQAAWDGFYEAIHEGAAPTIAHDGDEVFAKHVAAAVGIKTERGWRVSKKPSGGTTSSLHADKPIDALAAAVMAHFAATEYLAKRVEPMFAWV
jgi:phage terminase large subunit-like protein